MPLIPSSPFYSTKNSSACKWTGLVVWISSCVTDRLQYVRLKDITAHTVISSIGAPQGTVLSPLLFTLYTADFCYNSATCHIQKLADDTAVMGCITDDGKEEYYAFVLERQAGTLPFLLGANVPPFLSKKDYCLLSLCLLTLVPG